MVSGGGLRLLQAHRQCGFKVIADTTIRLWHVGSYTYGWEDSGLEHERTGSFTLHLGPKPRDEGK